MNTNRSLHFLTAAVGLAMLATAGCSEKATSTADPKAPAAIQGAVATSTALASDIWSEVKDYTYGMRVQFVAGFERMEAKVDDQIGVLATKRATLKSPTDTKAWDFAMKEMEDARSALKSSGEELSKATSETWSQAKDKVSQAWVRTQEAYANVKASTTT